MTSCKMDSLLFELLVTSSGLTRRKKREIGMWEIELDDSFKGQLRTSGKCHSYSWAVHTARGVDVQPECYRNTEIVALDRPDADIKLLSIPQVILAVAMWDTSLPTTNITNRHSDSETSEADDASGADTRVKAEQSVIGQPRKLDQRVGITHWRVMTQHPNDIHPLRPHPIAGVTRSTFAGFFHSTSTETLPPPTQTTSPEANVSDDDMAPSKTTELFRGNGTAEKAHTSSRPARIEQPFTKAEIELAD
ncbi:hypothetical protein B0H14DRAFT_3899664 [Mycena olivaceomarginata]|nr:hypothetical protein B0H14DRAFT_3899664 [Mycena olivaceomarginata]